MIKRRAPRKQYNDMPYCTGYYTVKGLEKLKEQAVSQGCIITRITTKYEQGIKYSKLWVQK